MRPDELQQRPLVDREAEGLLALPRLAPHLEQDVGGLLSSSVCVLLGAHVVGEQALEIVHVVAAGMESDMTVDELARLDIAYPTYTSVLGAAARQVMDELGVTSTAQWRAQGHTVRSPL